MQHSVAWLLGGLSSSKTLAVFWHMTEGSAYLFSAQKPID